ncbi:MAG: hypothetical protein IJ755_09465 [Bacteroidales bacterium]|nr:hypothetical protein [Bacteroidales bacterium]
MEQTSLLLLGILVLVFCICGFIVLSRKKKNPAPAPAEEPVPALGEPDDLVVIDPTRPDDPKGAILLYRREGLLVYDGIRIPIAGIKDVSFINASNPYLPEAYHLLLGMQDGQVLHIPAGNDRTLAAELAGRLRELIG